jgi:uroporphyrinogen decarboxylase
VTSRERLLKAINREPPDRVPIALAYEMPDDLCRQRGHPEMVGRLRQDVRWLMFETRPGNAAEFARYHGRMPEGATLDEWGIGYQRSSTGQATRRLHPLADVSRAADIERYPFPDMTQAWRHADLEKKVAAAHVAGLAAMGQMSQTIFELAWAMRGMEALLMDLTLNPALATALLDRITDIRCFMARRFTEAGVDVLRLGDDIGTQRGLLMSPETWRRWLKPGLARVIEAARSVNSAIPIKYHTDGNARDVIADLCDVGVTILNPVQPECLDPAALKREFGDRLAFWGCISVQSTLPFGTAADVQRAVREVIETVGAGGGLVIGPTHSVGADVPWENVLALYEAAEEYGVCGRG